MLSWWMGKSTTGERVEDGSEHEPPETPAPVFAARALKSAIFGAPSLDEDGHSRTEKKPDFPVIRDTRLQTRNVSPTRPPGILLTPGTAGTKRKTVTFGHEVMNRVNEKNAATIGQESSTSAALSAQEKVTSPFLPADGASEDRTTRKTSLTRQLERAREKKDTNDTSGDSTSSIVARVSDGNASVTPTDLKRETKPEVKDPASVQQLPSQGYHEVDITMDLNKPHSQSGKFWKLEYEQYHEQAKLEMKKLLNYKEMAKSYAKMKDAQAISMAEKLKEEQRRVAAMEDKISHLSARIANSGGEGSDDESPDLIKELARQTALAMQYRNQVEEFRATLEGNGKVDSPTKEASEKRVVSPRTEQTIRDTQRELKRAREQRKEMEQVRDEVETLKRALSTSEKKASKLQDENTKLVQELQLAELRLESHLKQCGNSQQSFELQCERKEEAIRVLQAQFDDLKERAKSQRRDAEQRLAKRHDQIIELRKEAASFRSAETKVKELQSSLDQQAEHHKEAVNAAEITISQLRERLSKYSSGHSGDVRPATEDAVMMPPAFTEHISTQNHPRSQESQIPIASQSISLPSKAASRRNRSETPNYSPRPKSSHPALSEIVNGASVDSVPPTRAGPVQHTPAGAPNRFSNQLLELDLDLPSPEPSINYAMNRLQHPSPRPSRFNFDLVSSPPKAVTSSQYPSSGVVGKRRSSKDLKGLEAGMAGSRLESSGLGRSRKEVPPERAAAAIKRLAERKEKGRRGGGGQKEVGKENVGV